MFVFFVCFHFASTKIIRLRCLIFSRRCHMLFTPSGPRISQKMEIPFPFCATINILVDYSFAGEGASLVGIVRACNRQPLTDLVSVVFTIIIHLQTISSLWNVFPPYFDIYPLVCWTTRWSRSLLVLILCSWDSIPYHIVSCEIRSRTHSNRQ